MYVGQFHINTLMLFGLILTTGVVGGQLAHNTRIFPRITGYIFVGFLLGPHISGILSEALLDQAKIFTELATGLILFRLGLQVDVQYIWKQKKLFWLGICESIFTFILIFGTLFLLNIQPIQAAIAAAIGVSSSPVILLITNEYNITGYITKNSLTLTAINNILAFCLYIVVLPFLHISAFPGKVHILNAFLHPFYRITGSLALTFLANCTLIYLARFIGKQKDNQFALISGGLVLSIGLSKMLNISMLFTMLMLGIFLTNFDRKQELMEIEFGHLGEIFFVLLFVITGTHLHMGLFLDAGLMAIVFILVRFLAKMVPIFFLFPKCGFTRKQSFALGLTLLPMAGMAIGLINTTMNLSVNLANSLAAMVFASVAILETIGPIVTVFALKMAGEINTAPHADIR